MASGAPDWQKVFTLVAPSMTHGAPDWERTAVGPSGTVIGGLPYYTGTVGIGITDNSGLGITIVEEGASAIQIIALGGMSIGGADGLNIENSGGIDITAPGSPGITIGNNAADKLGFFGAGPVDQPTAPATLAEVIAALQALGLVG